MGASISSFLVQEDPHLQKQFATIKFIRHNYTVAIKSFHEIRFSSIPNPLDTGFRNIDCLYENAFYLPECRNFSYKGLTIDYQASAGICAMYDNGHCY